MCGDGSIEGALDACWAVWSVLLAMLATPLGISKQGADEAEFVCADGGAPTACMDIETVSMTRHND